MLVPFFTSGSLLAQAPVASPPQEVLAPVLILALCVVAGVGTVMLLPGRHERALHWVGGVILAAAGLIFLAAVPALFVGGPNVSDVYFWIFSGIALVAALRVVTHPQPVYSALYFVLTVFASAGLFVLLEAEFMAAALVLIYAGAILITYVFVIMLASQAAAPGAPSPKHALGNYDLESREPMAAAAVGFGLMGVLLFVIFDRGGQMPLAVGPLAAAVAKPATIVGPTQELGWYLFQNQSEQLQWAGIILTVSMVGAMTISRRQVLVDVLAPQHGGPKPEVLSTPATPVDDNPHSIPVFGTDNPRQKAYPQT